MQNVSTDNFGPLVAYLVPGAVVLLGLQPHVPILQNWFAAVSPDAPTLGGFLYLTVSSLAAGMTINAIRWVCIDTFHALTGLPPPKLNFSRLAGREQAFALLISIHYQHYQFFANSFIATAIAYISYRLSTGYAGHVGIVDVAVIPMEIIFLLTSRDTLRKYYRRSEQLLSAK